MRSSTVLVALVNAALSVSVAWTPWALAAPTPSPTPDAQWQGMSNPQRGREVGGQARIDPSTMWQRNADGSYRMNPGQQTSNPQTFTLQDLFGPQSAGASSSTHSDLYYGASDDDIHSQSVQQRDSLQGGSSGYAQAYGAANASANQSRPDLRNDPIFAASDVAASSPWSVAEYFGDCEQTTTTDRSAQQGHVPDLRTCQRWREWDISGDRRIYHDYDIDPLFTFSAGGGSSYDIECETVPDSNPPRRQCEQKNTQYINIAASVEACGEGCMDLYVGVIGDNYWTGNPCRFYEGFISLNMVRPDAVSQATLDFAKWDDHMEVYLGGQVVWASGAMPEDTQRSCELDRSPSSGPGNDVTYAFQSQSNTYMAIRVAVGGLGEGYARVRVRYDPTMLIRDRGWRPPEAIRAYNYQDQFECPVHEFTVESSPHIDGAGCATTEWGVYACPHHFNEPPIDESPLVRVGRIKYDCNANTGETCYVDYHDELQCFNGDPGDADWDNCGELEASCGYISQRCVEGSFVRGDGEPDDIPDADDPGTCYVTEETYDCGYNVNYTNYATSTNTQCSGAVSCMGEECYSPDRDAPNQGFTQMATLYNMAQFIAFDNDCSNAGNCSVFPGINHYCKRIAGGTQDCCIDPTGIDIGKYLAMFYATNRLSQAAFGLDLTDPIYGAWNYLSEPVVHAVSEMVQPITSVLDNIGGATAERVGDVAATSFMDEVKQQLINKAAETMQNLFGDTATDFFFDQAAGSAGGAATDYAIDQTIVNLAGGVMTAYMVYTFTVLAIQLLYECEETELELASKRAVLLCQHKGSYCEVDTPFGCWDVRNTYCCYNSPLARIVSEQARAQLGMLPGTTEEPNCAGIPLSQLGNINWAAIDFSEWISIMAATGRIPGDNFDIERFEENILTGLGSTYDTGGRPSVSDRMGDRVEAARPDENRQDTSQSMRGNQPGSGGGGP